MERYTAIETILRHVREDDLVLITTGMPSREAFVADDRPGNFYMIGSMGLLSSLGLGLALSNKGQRVIVIDGDGSALMSLGTVPLIAYEAPENLHYVILDNATYESTGGQPCISGKVDLGKIVRAAGFRQLESVEDKKSLEQKVTQTLAAEGPTCMHVRVDVSHVEGIPRVSHSPEEIRDRFRKQVRSS
jgi:thiamine pyrophosphate-dependent acetolactate synthase large subunit-like protein